MSRKKATHLNLQDIENIKKAQNKLRSIENLIFKLQDSIDNVEQELKINKRLQSLGENLENLDELKQGEKDLLKGLSILKDGMKQTTNQINLFEKNLLSSRPFKSMTGENFVLPTLVNYINTSNNYNNKNF